MISVTNSSPSTKVRCHRYIDVFTLLNGGVYELLRISPRRNVEGRTGTPTYCRQSARVHASAIRELQQSCTTSLKAAGSNEYVPKFIRELTH